MAPWLARKQASTWRERQQGAHLALSGWAGATAGVTSSSVSSAAPAGLPAAQGASSKEPSSRPASRRPTAPAATAGAAACAELPAGSAAAATMMFRRCDLLLGRVLGCKVQHEAACKVDMSPPTCDRGLDGLSCFL